MPIALTCPQCRRPGQVPESYAGKTVNCPQCKARIDVPATASMPTATAARALGAVRKAELDAVVDNDLEPANEVAIADRADQDGAGRDDDYADVKDEDDEQFI